MKILMKRKNMYRKISNFTVYDHKNEIRLFIENNVPHRID